MRLVLSAVLALALTFLSLPGMAQPSQCNQMSTEQCLCFDVEVVTDMAAAARAHHLEKEEIAPPTWVLLLVLAVVGGAGAGYLVGRAL